MQVETKNENEDNNYKVDFANRSEEEDARDLKNVRDVYTVGTSRVTGQPLDRSAKADVYEQARCRLIATKHQELLDTIMQRVQTAAPQAGCVSIDFGQKAVSAAAQQRA